MATPPAAVSTAYSSRTSPLPPVLRTFPGRARPGDTICRGRGLLLYLNVPPWLLPNGNGIVPVPAANRPRRWGATRCTGASDVDDVARGVTAQYPGPDPVAGHGTARRLHAGPGRRSASDGPDASKPSILRRPSSSSGKRRTTLFGRPGGRGDASAARVSSGCGGGRALGLYPVRRTGDGVVACCHSGRVPHRDGASVTVDRVAERRRQLKRPSIPARG